MASHNQNSVSSLWLIGLISRCQHGFRGTNWQSKGDKLGSKIHLNGRTSDYGPTNVYRAKSVEGA